MVGIIVCKIMKVIKIEDKVIIDCLVENMDFVNAKSFQIIDENQKSFVTKKFEIDKPRSCFSVSKCIWVILKSDVPDSFLKVGNEICFCKKKTHINNIIFGRNLSFTIYLQNIKQYCNLVVYVVLYNI